MKKKCKNCGKEFECYNIGKSNRGRGSRLKSKRSYNSVTCSKKCSLEYRKIRTRIYVRNYRRRWNIK